MTCIADSDQRAPQTIGSRMALLLAFVSGAAVANVYYAQPLLDDLGAQLQMSPAALGWVTTATQGGYLLGLVMVVPLGDRFDRRRIILIQLAATAVGLLGAAAAPSAWTFLVFSALFGAASTVVQVITAFAAAASPPGRRGRTVGVVTSGVVLGILLARTVSGFIADLWGWRSVFGVAAVVMLGVAVLLVVVLPRDTIAKDVVPYRHALASVVVLTLRDRTFRVRSLIGGLMFASFGAAWGSMALPLATAPWHLTTAQIGLFGIVGAAGALGASGAGRWADRGRAEAATGAMLDRSSSHRGWPSPKPRAPCYFSRSASSSSTSPARHFTSSINTSSWSPTPRRPPASSVATWCTTRSAPAQAPSRRPSPTPMAAGPRQASWEPRSPSPPSPSGPVIG